MKTLVILLLLAFRRLDVSGKANEDFFVFRVQEGMFMMDLQGAKYIHPQMRHFPGELPLALDPVTNRLFVRCCGSTITSYDIRNETLVRRAQVNPYREANSAPMIKDGDLDYLSSILFVTDFNRGKIIAFNSDLTKEWTVVSDTMNPYAIAVDPVSRLLFWSSTYSNTIMRSYLDGRHQNIIVQHDLGKVVAMAIDVHDRRLFWADLDLEKIESSDLAGQGRRVILTARDQQIRGLTVDEDWVYFTSYLTNNVFKADKRDGYNVTKMGNRGSESFNDGMLVEGMVLRKQSLIVTGNSSCSTFNGGCTHLCIPTLDGHTCAGPDKMYTVLPKSTTSTTSTTTTTTTTKASTMTTITTTKRPTTTKPSATTSQTTTKANSSTSSTLSSSYPTSSETLSRSTLESSSSVVTTTRNIPTSSETEMTTVGIAVPTGGVIDKTVSGNSSSWKIVAGVLILFGGLIAAGVAFWVLVIKRRGKKLPDMMENPAYSTRGPLGTATARPPSYGEIDDDLYSEISPYNDSIWSDDSYMYPTDRKYENGANNPSNRYYNHNSGKFSNCVGNDIEENVKLPNDGYEVPISSTYCDMRPKSQVPLIMEEEGLDESQDTKLRSPNSQIYEKFDANPTFAQKEKEDIDTYSIGPTLERPRKPKKEEKEHNYMNYVEPKKSPLVKMKRAHEIRDSDLSDITDEVPQYRNVLLLGTLKRDTDI